MAAVEVDRATPTVVCEQQDPLTSSSHCRETQCLGGQSVPQGQALTRRVADTPSHFQKHLPTVVPPTDRPVCHEVQSPVTSVCLSDSGSRSLHSGCLSVPVDRKMALRLSTSSTVGASITEAPVRTLSPDIDHISKTAQTVIQRSCRHVSRHTPGTAGQSRAPTTRRVVPPTTRVTRSTCMAPVTISPQDDTLSAEVVQRIAAPQRGSTRAMYGSKLRFFKHGVKHMGLLGSIPLSLK